MQNKVGAFLANPFLYPILTQPTSAFNLRKIMDEGKVLLVNLSKGKIGEDTAALLGGLLIARIALAALSRSEIPEKDRRDFYLYLDEFQSFPTSIIANMLSELRKFHCGIVLSNQFLFQLDPAVKSAILGNVGTLISFRVGLEDALT
ncbi:MAG TPA: type IV secretory system conjugative DNA transfer family protein, partial [Verrucomicrobiae bacterium]|nr:type IV secretory system conjugative DNA transfer family protein [Verrucomicrobiae bacterium]